MEVLDEHDHGALGRELGEKVDPLGVQALAGGQRMEVGRDGDPEREPEDLALAQAAAHGLGRLGLHEAELLAEDVRERPVRRPAPIGQAAPGPAERLGRLPREAMPELAHEPGFPHTGVAHGGDEAWAALLQNAGVGGVQEVELALAPDEDRAEPSEPGGPHERQRPHQRAG